MRVTNKTSISRDGKESAFFRKHRNYVCLHTLLPRCRHDCWETGCHYRFHLRQRKGKGHPGWYKSIDALHMMMPKYRLSLMD